jgi:hypothetical protein
MSMYVEREKIIIDISPEIGSIGVIAIMPF